jgi:Na+/proline symporter
MIFVLESADKFEALGGFKISFITDNIQGAMVILLSKSHLCLDSFQANYVPVIVATITVGVETKIDKSLIDSSGLTKPTLLGWQLLYILPIAVLTNDFFLSNFWIRTFASKTDKDLWIGVSIAAVVTLIILTLVGATGLIATWSGAFDPNNPDQDGSIAFFLLLEQLPAWTVGIVLVMVVSLSTAAFDSFQSAMVSTASNDLFRNKINIWWIRVAVVLIIFPVVVLALKAPSILQIYLISDLVSASTIPVLILGLNDRFYWWRGFEVVVGGLGGLLTVFIFGTIYFGDALQGAKLILLEQGLYGDDWSAFGAFVAAPFGGLLWGFAALGARLAYRYIEAKVKGHRFDALDRPAYLDHHVQGTSEYAASDEIHSDPQAGLVTVDHKGKFF